jgi:hypothetical protein
VQHHHDVAAVEDVHAKDAHHHNEPTDDDKHKSSVSVEAFASCKEETGPMQACLYHIVPDFMVLKPLEKWASSPFIY